MANMWSSVTLIESNINIFDTWIGNLSRDPLRLIQHLYTIRVSLFLVRGRTVIQAFVPVRVLNVCFTGRKCSYRLFSN